MMNQPRILVVDDQESILESFATLLERQQSETSISLADLEAALGGDVPDATVHPEIPTYGVAYARQGKDGLAICQKAIADGYPLSVAFVDVHMPPGMDGVETALALWRLQPDLEIVLCTAHAVYSWKEILAKLPRRDQLVILRKPFDPIEVRQLAACLTEKVRRGRELAEQLAQLEARVQQEVTRRLHTELANYQKFEDLGRLAAGIAHEISTPAQYILSNLDFLSEVLTEVIDDPTAPVPFDELRAAVEEATHGVKRVTTIVRSVREFSHPSAGRFEEVDVNQLVRMAAELARSEYKYDAELVLQLGAVPHILAQADELGRAVMNLLINAAHAIRAKHQGKALGHITVVTRIDGDSVSISVADDGTGISEEHRSHIFEPFFTTKPRGEGTGQGLPFVHATAERHGGHISFDTRPGVGTTFVVALPATLAA
ncbi:MAG TPA: hybrid sensor histidine kinase/response regulator [Kofleriaceae bacterium]|jgi:signal transduction histidine kinase